MISGATYTLPLDIRYPVRNTDKIIITLKNESTGIKRTKRYPNDEETRLLADGRIGARLTQQDTVDLVGYVKIEAQINLKSGSVAKTATERTFISPTLNTEMVVGAADNGENLLDGVTLELGAPITAEGEGTSFQPGNALELKDGILNVLTTDGAEKGNNLPITSEGARKLADNISYNDLKDRPFYADEQVWADWSDDVEGLEPILDGVFCLISEQPITPEIIEESVFSVTVPDVGVVELSSEVKENGVITLGQYGDTVFCSVHTTDLAEMLGVPIGVYVNAEMATFITQLISNRIKQIDYRVLPSATLTKKGAVSLADIIDKIVDYNDFFELSDSTAYRDAYEGFFGRTLFNLISYNGASYFCYYKTEIGHYGNSNSAAYTKINLYCIDYRNSELKTILLTFPYEPADDDTPTSIELLP